MPDFSFSFDKLLICDPDKSRSICHTFISQPSPAEEKSLGKLFMLTEISSKDRINIDIINTIHEEIKISYYNTEDLNIETAFEKSLESVNQRIADMVGNYDTNWLDKLNTIIIVIKDDIIHLSYIGTIHAFMTREQKINDILQSTLQDEPLKEKINPLKAFSNIVSGSIKQGDNFIFCTPSLLDYFSQEKIKRIITEHSATQAVGMIDNMLSDNTTDASFGAIFLKINPEESIQPSVAPAAIPSPHKPAETPHTAAYDTPDSSIADLLQKQKDTGKILAPSLSGYFWNSLRNAWQKITNFIKLTIFRQSPRRVRLDQQQKKYQPIQKPAYGKKNASVSFINAASGIAKQVGRLLTDGFSTLYSLIRKKGETENSLTIAPTSFNERTSKIIIKFKNLPKISKGLLAIALIVAFILSQSIFNLAQSEQKKELDIEYDGTVSLISQKILKAEAALSYGNEDGAKELLDEAQNLIDNLSDKTSEQKNKINELNNDVRSQLEITKHIIVVEPRQITSFSTPTNPANTKDLVLLNNSLYTFDPDKKTIYSADIDSGEVTSWPQDTLTNTFQYLITQNNNSLIFLNTANKIDEFKTNIEQVNSLEFNLPVEEVNIAGLFIYDSRLYLLDIKNSQVYRSFRTGNGYSNPVEWIKDSTNLNEAKSMAIDGFIYILEKSGRLIKFLQGNQQDWSLANIDPALNKADKVWTDTDTDNLYIMDTQGKRIIEFSKQGNLLNQYTSESFTNLKDFTVDYANKIVYLLNDNSALTFDLQP